MLLLLEIVITIAGIVTSASAAVPSAIEPEYSDAIILVNQKDYKGALALLKKLDRPEHSFVEIKELIALSQKSLNLNAEALRTYQTLMGIKRRLKAPTQELAPYAFEAGMLLQRLGREREARSYFVVSHRNGFNVSASQMYLGMYDFKVGDLDSAAEYFEGVVRGQLEELKAPAYFYLGQIYLKIGRSSAGIESFMRAQALTANQPESLIHKTSKETLAPYSEPSYFGQLSANVGYDTNVLSVPTDVESSAESTGKAAVTNTFGVGVGYYSPSLATFQFVPSYRGSLAINHNDNAQAAEFAYNTLSMSVNVNPLHRFNWGAKLEGMYSFRNELDATTNKSKFKKFNRSANLGGFLRYEFAPYWTVSFEALWQPKTYFSDLTVTEDSKRSGKGYSLNLDVAWNRKRRWFNPTIKVNRTQDEARGREYRSKSHKIQIVNTLELHDRWGISFAGSIAVADYPLRPSGAREDKTLNFQQNTSYKISSRLTALFSFDATINSSTVPTSYEYNRMTVTGGVSYSIF